MVARVGSSTRTALSQQNSSAPSLSSLHLVRATGLASRFSVLNLSHVDMRPDGHVSGAMAWHADGGKATAGRDCLHYCLPGPTDAWAHALYAMLLQNDRFAAPRKARVHEDVDKDRGWPVTD